MGSKYVIIGDGIAGATAAKEIREKREDAKIHVYTDESEPLYNRIMLKSYMKGDLPGKKFTRLHDKNWYDKRDIEIFLETPIKNVNTDKQTLETFSGKRVDYDKLLIATGGSPRELPFGEYDNLHYMWTMHDATEIKEAAEQSERAVVIGGGLLGIDLAMAYAEHNCETYYLIKGSNWWERGLNKEGAEIIHRKMEEKGVIVKTETEAADFYGDQSIEKVELDGGDSIDEVDSVAVAIGQTPNSDIVDVEKTDVGMIKTDEYLETSEENVYAAGNMVEYYSPIFERRTVNGSWDHSKAMGKYAAENMLGQNTEFNFINTYGVGHFDVQFLAIGDWYGEEVHTEKRGSDIFEKLFFNNGRFVGGIFIGSNVQVEEVRSLIKSKREKKVVLETLS